MQNGLHFNYSSLRSQKGRLGILISKPVVRGGLLASIAVLGALGVTLLLAGLSVGWLFASLGAYPLMTLIWLELDLRSLPPGKDEQQLDDILDGDVLGMLPDHPSPKQIAEAVMKVKGGFFFAVRFGIGPSFLTSLSSAEMQDSSAVWARANALRKQFGSPTITAPMLLAALVEQMPDHDQLLAQVQLSLDDIMAGVGWHYHLRQIIAIQNMRGSTGGIARDWSFGYTPLLERFALNVSEQVQSGGLLNRELEGHQQIMAQMSKLLSGGGRQNVVLVGPTGAGKTTLVYALAKQLITPYSSVANTLRYRQVMALDPASLIAQARGRGELEGLVQQLFMEAYKAKNIIIFLDEAQLFLQDGTGSVDLSNLLLPIIQGGGLRIIMAMDEQRWLQLNQTNPGLTQNMNRLSVPPLARPETLLVLEDQLMIMEFRYKVTYMYQSLQEAYRLADRYVQDQAMPGKAIMVLEAAAQFAVDGLVSASSVQQAVEKMFGVKVAHANAVDEREKLLNMEQLIHERMINQTRAVSVVSNALRRARAGVRNQDRPIGTFLFLGPTGVGKTELAKSLAAVYFGGESRMVRLDLNEFGQPGDVSRLIADGAQDPNSLTAQIGKQPFSVVLLDEIEKAHPNVLNTLLQLLDEGVLRDINNRAISFRDAIVIATSNAGADRIRQYITAGYELEQFEQQFVDELIDSGQFKPEFLNRFDEIVVFRPLKQEELMQVTDLILAGINKTLAPQKVSVTLDDEAKVLLVKTGYDPRLGARPLRRVVQRAVEDLVARRMLSGQVAAGSVMHITLADVQAVLGEV